ncbi:MAG: tetratricopeptide repeat protein [Candidatus Wallbacteria bacterium]|nr:tetratricopeptide repeat protein [Candidatus Wallbacteria bacterium]
MRLAIFYEEGKGVSQDYKEAAKWYLKAASQGKWAAQGRLAHLYEEGKGVDRDYKEAFKWYRLSAENGDAFGQLGFGRMYLNGTATLGDYCKAFEWFNKSADQGNAEAQFEIAQMYSKGKGMAADGVKALMWAKISTASGFDKTTNFQKEVISKLAPEQIEKAQTLANAWIEKHPITLSPPRTSVDKMALAAFIAIIAAAAFSRIKSKKIKSMKEKDGR